MRWKIVFDHCRARCQNCSSVKERAAGISRAEEGLSEEWAHRGQIEGHSLRRTRVRSTEYELVLLAGY